MPSIIDCATPDYAEPLAELGRRTFIDAFGHLYKAEDLSAFLEVKHSPAYYEKQIRDPQTRIWGLETEGALVGYCIAGPCDLPVPDMPARSGLLDRLYIERDFRGGGNGSRLLAVAMAWLQENFDHVYVSVFSENYGAQKLYAGIGFEKAHEYYFMVGNHPDHEYIMKLRRPAAPEGE